MILGNLLSLPKPPRTEVFGLGLNFLHRTGRRAPAGVSLERRGQAPPPEVRELTPLIKFPGEAAAAGPETRFVNR